MIHHEEERIEAAERPFTMCTPKKSRKEEEEGSKKSIAAFESVAAFMGGKRPLARTHAHRCRLDLPVQMDHVRGGVVFRRIVGTRLCE